VLSVTWAMTKNHMQEARARKTCPRVKTTPSPALAEVTLDPSLVDSTHYPSLLLIGPRKPVLR